MTDFERRLREALSPQNPAAIKIDVDGDDVAIRDDACGAWFAYSRSDCEAWLATAEERKEKAEAGEDDFGWGWEPYQDFCRQVYPSNDTLAGA